VTITTLHRPSTPLAEACTPYKAALDEYERLERAAKMDEAAKQWLIVQNLALAFRQGAEHAMEQERARATRPSVGRGR